LPILGLQQATRYSIVSCPVQPLVQILFPISGWIYGLCGMELSDVTSLITQESRVITPVSFDITADVMRL